MNQGDHLKIDGVAIPFVQTSTMVTEAPGGPGFPRHFQADEPAAHHDRRLGTLGIDPFFNFIHVGNRPEVKSPPLSSPVSEMDGLRPRGSTHREVPYRFFSGLPFHQANCFGFSVDRYRFGNVRTSTLRVSLKFSGSLQTVLTFRNNPPA